MSRTELLITASLALLGIGVSAGQGFTVNRWVLLFWGAAALVAIIGFIHKALDPTETRRQVRIVVDVKPGLARVGPQGVIQKPSADLLVFNKGAPLKTVVRGRFLKVPQEFDWAPTDEWEIRRDVEGAVGHSFFHIATLHYEDDKPCVVVRGEHMVIIRRWFPAKPFSFDLEFKLLRDVNGTLYPMTTELVSVSLRDDLAGFNVSRR